MKSVRCLIVFVRYPQAGQVKTRLAQSYGHPFASGLYRAFVFDILANLAKGDYRFHLCFDPLEKETQIKKLLGSQYEYRAQQGADLGERMKNAFTRCFSEGVQSAVLIGSDCPDLPHRVVQDAFMCLEGRYDAAIGPAADGGYYLIGFKKEAFLQEIFQGPRWGASSVLKETKDMLRAGGLRLTTMSQWRDIDTSEDLADFVERSRGTPFAHSRTMAFLKTYGMVPISS